MLIAKATRISNELIDLLRPACDRIEIAGSVRRGKPDVKDIEIIAIPKPERPKPEFGKPIACSGLDMILNAMASESRIFPIKDGQKYKQFMLPQGIRVDLFLVTPPAQWGVLDVIRTGPAEFSKWMVTSQARGGALPNYAQIQDGRVRPASGQYAPEAMLPMPEEIDFFKFCGLDWKPPNERGIK